MAAARNGIVEMVQEILIRIPSAIHNTNSKKENVLLVAVKHRQPLVVETLKTIIIKDSKEEVWNNLMLAVDDEESTVLHLAAEALGGDKPWQIAGSALQMMWDIKWFQVHKIINYNHACMNLIIYFHIIIICYLFTLENSILKASCHNTFILEATRVAKQLEKSSRKHTKVI